MKIALCNLWQFANPSCPIYCVVTERHYFASGFWFKRNLPDGKASQTDLETLQTAVNGKQDKIDSTHKLDADLVDDSTSTNKFTNASNLSKLSGIESGAEVNTIETISLNGTPVTPDANRNVNIASGGALYKHRIDFYAYNGDDTEIEVEVVIINSDNTEINSLALFSNNKNKIISFNMSGDDPDDLGGYSVCNYSITSVSSTSVTMIGKYVNNGNIDSVYVDLDTTNGYTIQFNDLVTQL